MLIENLASVTEVTKPQARVMADGLVELIEAGVRREGPFPLSGLGTFAVGKRTARTRLDLATGAKVKIKPRRPPSFAASDWKAVAMEIIKRIALIAAIAITFLIAAVTAFWKMRKETLRFIASSVVDNSHPRPRLGQAAG